MGEVKLNFLLMGKTGQGKSATGNTLLNRRFFKTSSNSTSETKEVDFSFAQWGKYISMVVDGPGLEDTDINKAKDTETAAKNMDKALAMCYGGIDAFLLVTKFGTRFTAEDRSTLETLKQIFGQTYLNHVIVVMTGGDLFQDSMEEEQCFIGFHDWCRKQIGELRDLYKDCNGRFVLLNNREKDETKKEAQVLEIFKIAYGLHNDYGSYTSECFKAAEASREKLILTHKAPQLTKEIQEKISLLTAEIDAFSRNPTDATKDKIKQRVQALQKEIEIQDKGFGVLQEMRELARKVADNLDDIEELQNLSKKLESTRKSKTIWTALGAVCTFVGSGIAIIVSAPVIAAVAAGGAVVAGVAGGINYVVHRIQENTIEKQQEEIRNKKK